MPFQLKEEMGHSDSAGQNWRMQTIGAETLNLEIPECNAVTLIVNNMASGEPQTVILEVSSGHLGNMSGDWVLLKLAMEG
jgi:hypothetical protein